MKSKLSFLMIGLLLCACNKPVAPSTSESSSMNSLPSDSLPSSTPSESSTSGGSSTTSDSSTSSESASSESSIYDSSNPIDLTTPVYKEKNVLNYLGSDNDIYRINITTEDNAFPVDKENYINGSLNISDQQKKNTIFEDATMKIKLRGNSTMVADKKPFKIKFDKKQSLFGLPKAKNWVLLANYYDKSSVRNYLAYITANKLNHLNYQPSSIFVDVYFNGTYQGLYLLCEQMEMKEGRVDIANHYSADGITSFLIEADERAKSEYAGLQGIYYVSSGRYDFAIKDPNPDDFMEALQIANSQDNPKKEEAQKTVAEFIKNAEWLQGFMDNVSEAVYTHTNYSDYIDVDSFIDYYLVEEFFKNLDVGSTSQFYYIDQEQEKVKLAAGPVWDFDIGAAVVDKTSSDVYTWYANEDYFVRERDYYLSSLFEDPEFEQKVKDRYKEVRERVFVAVFDEFELVLKTLSKALRRNVITWPLTSERKTWVEEYALSANYYACTILKQHNDLLETFLRHQLELLDARYLD